MAGIELQKVSITLRGSENANPWSILKKQSSFTIKDLDLEVPDGKVVAVLGPSGCGKSTLLRLIAGLLPPDSGRVLYDGEDMSAIPPAERKIGMVFQNYALYPNYSGKSNVLGFFLFKKRTPELDQEAREKYRRTAELLGVELEKLMGRMPKGLSGGEAQRVAVGRCITRDPRLLLFDEPLSNLDPKLRERYRSQIRVLLRQFAITTIYVTHDQIEALAIADLIAVMNVGRIEQVGTAQDIYNEPKSVFSADFINFDLEAPSMNLLDGAFISADMAGYNIGIRPEKIRLEKVEGRPSVEGKVIDVRNLPLRKESIICVRAGTADIFVKTVCKEGLSAGANVIVSFEQCHLFRKDDGTRQKTI